MRAAIYMPPFAIEIAFSTSENRNKRLAIALIAAATLLAAFNSAHAGDEILHFTTMWA